jgi:hypothetical protein
MAIVPDKLILSACELYNDERGNYLLKAGPVRQHHVNAYWE